MILWQNRTQLCRNSVSAVPHSKFLQYLLIYLYKKSKNEDFSD